MKGFKLKMPLLKIQKIYIYFVLFKAFFVKIFDQYWGHLSTLCCLMGSLFTLLCGRLILTEFKPLKFCNSYRS